MSLKLRLLAQQHQNGTHLHEVPTLLSKQFVPWSMWVLLDTFGWRLYQKQSRSDGSVTACGHAFHSGVWRWFLMHMNYSVCDFSHATTKQGDQQRGNFICIQILQELGKLLFSSRWLLDQWQPVLRTTWHWSRSWAVTSSSLILEGSREGWWLWSTRRKSMSDSLEGLRVLNRKLNCPDKEIWKQKWVLILAVRTTSHMGVLCSTLAPDSSFLSIQILRHSGDDTSNWVSDPNMRNAGWVLGLWLWPGPTLADTESVNQRIGALFFFFFHVHAHVHCRLKKKFKRRGNELELWHSQLSCWL